MTTELEDQITNALTRRAERAPDDEAIAQSAFQRGRRLRTRRQILTGVAAVSAVAIAVPVGLKALPDRDSGINAVNPAPKPSSPLLPANRQQVTIELSKLKRGADPKVPWFSDGVIHNGSVKTPVALKQGEGMAFAPLEGGNYLVVVVSLQDGRSSIRIVRADGSKLRDLPNQDAAVSVDRKRLAWVEPIGTRTGKSNIILADARGREIDRVPYSGAGTILAGFAGDRVVLTASDLKSFFLWDPGKGVTQVKNSVGANATDGGDIVTGIVPGAGGSQCLGVYSLSAGKRLWSTCALEGPGDVRFDKSGKLLALTTGHEFGPGAKDPKRVLVLDVGSGKSRLDIRLVEGKYTGLFEPLHWLFEPDGTLLIMTAGPKQQALVRCSLADGSCELASEIGPHVADHSGIGAPPYIPLW